MKRLLNTLYVTSQGAYLARERETVLVRSERQTRLRVPIHALDGIVCFGQVSMSPPLIGLCGERGVSVSLLSERGRFLGRWQGPVSGNVLLRRQQYRLADSQEASGELARVMVAAKVMNSRTVLKRGARERPEEAGALALAEAASRLGRVLTCLREPVTVDAARGYEGEASRIYFGVFDHLIKTQEEAFAFHSRSRRPPLDNINALLSFLYTLLVHDVASALEAVGLDPAVGYLHRDRPGRPGLALDLMEEFRSYLADRLALSLVNRRQVNGQGFQQTETKAVMMDDGTRKKVLQAYQKRKQEVIRHPFLGEKVAVGLVPHVQAMLLSRHIRGDLDAYPPFVWK